MNLWTIGIVAEREQRQEFALVDDTPPSNTKGRIYTGARAEGVHA